MEKGKEREDSKMNEQKSDDKKSFLSEISKNYLVLSKGKKSWKDNTVSRLLAKYREDTIL